MASSPARGRVPCWSRSCTRLGSPVSESKYASCRICDLRARLASERDRELAHLVGVEGLLQVEELLRRRNARRELARDRRPSRRWRSRCRRSGRSRGSRTPPRRRRVPAACACRGTPRRSGFAAGRVRAHGLHAGLGPVGRVHLEVGAGLGLRTLAVEEPGTQALGLARAPLVPRPAARCRPRGSAARRRRRERGWRRRNAHAAS